MTMFRMTSVACALLVAGSLVSSCGPSATTGNVQDEIDKQVNPPRTTSRRRSCARTRSAEGRAGTEPRGAQGRGRGEGGVRARRRSRGAEGIPQRRHLRVPGPPDYTSATTYFQSSCRRTRTSWKPTSTLEWLRAQARRGCSQGLRRSLKANPGSGSAKGYIGKCTWPSPGRPLLPETRRGAPRWRPRPRSCSTSHRRGCGQRGSQQRLALYWLMKAQAEQDKAVASTRFHVRGLRAERTHAPASNVVALNTRGLIYLIKGELQIARWIFEKQVLRLDQYSTRRTTILASLTSS